MEFVRFGVILVISFVVGTLGFSQIIGSIQTKQHIFAFTIILWVLILISEFFLVRIFASNQIIPYAIGTGISFFMVLKSGKIE